MIALFSLLGGLGIIGSGFADILDSTKTNIWAYVFRTIVGMLAIGAAYGIIEHQRWALWLFLLIVLIGLFNNPVVTLFPAAAFIYLVSKHSLFEPSKIDRQLASIWEIIKENIRNYRLKRERPN